MTRGALSVCARPADALALAAADEGAFALLGDGEGYFSLAFMTPFGPCVRRYPAGDGLSFMAVVAAQNLAAGQRVAALWMPDASGRSAAALALAAAFDASDVPPAGPPGAAADALAEFAARRPRDGHTAWTASPMHERPFRNGESLVARIEPCAGGHAVMWGDRDGRDAGVHVVIPRDATPPEEAIVSACVGRVLTEVACVMPGADGAPRMVQVLYLDVGHAFAAAFHDGRRPRHGLLPGLAA